MDWTGNKNSVFKTLAATNHSEEDRASGDFYATEPEAVRLLLTECQKPKSNNIWECACGDGQMSKVLMEYGYNVKSTDLYNRGYGESGVNFLSDTITKWDGDIITNPPYKYALKFVEKALDIIPEGNNVIMFLKLQFVESKSRKKLFLSNPPRTIYISSSRLYCAKNGDFSKRSEGSAVAYAWYVWEKGFNGITELKWFN